MSLKKLILLLISLTLYGTAAGADLAREQRIAEQIEDAILDGDPVYLDDAGHPFLGIYMRSDADQVKGAVLVLHGRGANPDWIDVVQPLRIGLTEHGWDTLSIQLPVAYAGADDREWLTLVPQAAPRISAAVEFLKQRKILNIALVAHSFGSRMAAAYLADNPAPEIKAFVAIGMSADKKNRNSGSLGALRKITLPTYDLYGERDLPQVLDSAKERRLAARDADNKAYRQYQAANADHFFSGQDRHLLSLVRTWLNDHAKGEELGQ